MTRSPQAPTVDAVNEDGQRWQAVDPADRAGACLHERRYAAEDTAVTMCLFCGAEVEPVLAPVIDLHLVRRLRRGQN